MRRLLAVALALALTACSSGNGEDSTTTSAPDVVTTTATAAQGSTTTVPVNCPEAPYVLTFLPPGVGQGTLDTDSLALDVWTSAPGSRTTFIPREDDTVAIAMIRGTLPTVDWPGEKGEVSIDGTRAVVGPHPDGTWVAGWYEEPAERCDLYSMVFYPPWNPSDVEAVINGMNRVGG